MFLCFVSSKAVGKVSGAGGGRNKTILRAKLRSEFNSTRVRRNDA